MNSNPKETALVLSGGGTRAAYQIGALKAIAEKYSTNHTAPFSILMASSIGAVNSLLLNYYLPHGLSTAIENISSIWKERTYRSTFSGSPTRAFIRSLTLGFLKYFSPTPTPTNFAVFDPSPLVETIDSRLNSFTGTISNHPIETIGIMTTVEGISRKGLLLAKSSAKLTENMIKGASFDIAYFDRLSASHALASAAIPSILPPVQLSLETRKVSLLDGGICDNRPVDPAVRFGAKTVYLLDVSGRKWWCDHYGHPHYKRDPWEATSSEGTYCLNPEKLIELRTEKSIGTVLKHSVGKSTRDFISALGPTWPLFKIIKTKLGETVAYEIMSYVAIHPEYINALLEMGYQETIKQLRR